jgi:hypothetical protein
MPGSPINKNALQYAAAARRATPRLALDPGSVAAALQGR